MSTRGIFSCDGSYVEGSTDGDVAAKVAALCEVGCDAFFECRFPQAWDAMDEAHALLSRSNGACNDQQIRAARGNEQAPESSDEMENGNNELVLGELPLMVYTLLYSGGYGRGGDTTRFGELLEQGIARGHSLAEGFGGLTFFARGEYRMLDPERGLLLGGRCAVKLMHLVPRDEHEEGLESPPYVTERSSKKDKQYLFLALSALLLLKRVGLGCRPSNRTRTILVKWVATLYNHPISVNAQTASLNTPEEQVQLLRGVLHHDMLASAVYFATFRLGARECDSDALQEVETLMRRWSQFGYCHCKALLAVALLRRNSDDAEAKAIIEDMIAGHDTSRIATVCYRARTAFTREQTIKLLCAAAADGCPTAHVHLAVEMSRGGDTELFELAPEVADMPFIGLLREALPKEASERTRKILGYLWVACMSHYSSGFTLLANNLESIAARPPQSGDSKDMHAIITYCRVTAALLGDRRALTQVGPKEYYALRHYTALHVELVGWDRRRTASLYLPQQFYEACTVLIMIHCFSNALIATTLPFELVPLIMEFMSVPFEAWMPREDWSKELHFSLSVGDSA